MTNYIEYRLHQIEILLNAFKDEPAYLDEKQKLITERQEILKKLDIIKKE